MALSTNGRISMYCFCLAGSVMLMAVFGLLGPPLAYLLQDYWLPIALLHTACIHALLYFIYKPRGYAYKIAWRAGLLGSTFSIGILTSWLALPSWTVFGWYMALISFFHYSEYLTTAVINPKSLTLNSFLINHSREYGIAAAGSWIEFFVERFLYPDMKQIRWLSAFGVMLCLSGEVLRKMAMLTAGSNFNHIIRSHREEGHTLVTHGIYSLFRHPSYVGWFWWSIGTQLVLCNPVCLLCYTIVSWRFFRRRIEDEEITLLNFFGEDYVSYQRTVPTGLPLIRGYRLEL